MPDLASISNSAMAAPVAVQGMGWGSIPQWGLLFAFLGALVAAWPKLQKNKNDSDASLRKDLMARISEVERQGVEDRKAHAAEVAEIRAAHEREMAEQRRSQEAQQKAHEVQLSTMQRAHERELAEMRGQVAGLRNQLIQMGSTTGSAIQIGGFNAPEAMASIPRVAAARKQRGEA